MDDQYHGVEKRKFFRIAYEESIRYKTVFTADLAITKSEFSSAISKNLSCGGMIFKSATCPQISSIILLELDPNKIPERDLIKKTILLLSGKPLAKVIRVEERENGYYDIGVVFVTHSNNISINIKNRLAIIRRNKYIVTWFGMLFTSFVIIATLLLNFAYRENKETYRPNRNMYTIPLSIGIQYDDVNFKTEDGQILKGWFIPVKKSKSTILYCMGRTGNICDELVRVNFLHNIGVNILIFNYRGYGNSSGEPSEEGLYKDARAAYDYLISRNDIDKDKIVILGMSLGGAVATDLCLKRKAAALILESSIASLVRQTEASLPLLPIGFLPFEKYDTLSKIKNVHIPKLIVHGLDDETIAFEDGFDLFYAACEPKQFLPFHGSHDDDMFKISSDYRVKMIKFLTDNNLL